MKKQDIQVLTNRIKINIPDTSMRGSGLGRFLFSQLNGRCVEASLDENEHIWIEFWDVGEGEAVDAIKDFTTNNIEEAELHILTWLRAT